MFDLTESSDNFYKIKVVAGRYKAQFDFSTPVDEENSKIKVIKSKLILNASEYKRGQIIRGHTEFLGKCKRDCDWVRGLITLDGNFVAKIE